ncbi:MAG: hypothetical protein DCC55_34815 [Chloroflexi bacterium]|nr:MAG: hypothetical protein DCC55_34815 [Chloroflexota bacterium]
MPSLNFKIAGEPWEFEQIHRLVYQGFVEEIPYHSPNTEQRLVDRFHAENTYAIASDGGHVVGMCAIRDRRPFSLDQKLANLDDYLPPHKKVGEFRLLFVLPAYRNGVVFRNLLDTLTTHSISQGMDLAVLAGTTRQLRLYRHMGFIPFGPLVGAPGAQFQPMYWTLNAARSHIRWLSVLQSNAPLPAAA